MTSLFNNMSIFHHKDNIRFLNGRQTMSHNKTGTSSCMENAEFIDHPDVDEILGTEAAAYEFIEKKMSAK